MKGGLGLSAIPGTLGTVMRGFAAARTVIAGFGLSSLAALWPVVLAVAAVAAVAFVIYKYWKPLKAFFAGFWEGLTKGLEPLTPLFDAFVGTLSGIWTAVQPYLQPVLDWFGDFFNLTQVGEGNARSWGGVGRLGFGFGGQYRRFCRHHDSGRLADDFRRHLLIGRFGMDTNQNRL